MPPILPVLKKTLILLHRWMGVTLCSLFFLWFTSGIGMMYWDYPEVSAADRLLSEGALDPFQVKLSPQEAYSQLQSDRTPGEVRLTTFDGRPAYRFHNDHTDSIVYADNGETVTTCSHELTLRIASRWTGQPAAIVRAFDRPRQIESCWHFLRYKNWHHKSGFWPLTHEPSVVI